MKTFQINSQIYSNIYLLSQQEFVNSICTIHINKIKTIKLPLILAIASSSLISQQLHSDITQREFYLNSSISIDNSLYNKIEDALKMKEIQLENENEIYKFAKFGQEIGNDQFMLPFNKYCEEAEEICDKNIYIDILKHKISLKTPILECSKEINFIAKYFLDLENKLYELGKDINNLEIIQEIIKSDSLVLESEDNLLNFVLKLCGFNKAYESLFEYVWLEYCSVDSVKTFIGYVQENIFTSVNSIWAINCINRRLIQEIIPLQPHKIRHTNNNNSNNDKSSKITYDDAIEAIFTGSSSIGLSSSDSDSSVFYDS